MKSRMTPCSFAALSLAFALGACSAESDEGPATELEAIDADEIVYGVSRRMTREGVQEALLMADSMFMWRDSSHARVIGLTLIIFDEQGRRRANITADGGRVSDVASELTATGNAVLRISTTGQEIRTEELNFAPESDRIWSDVPVEILEGGCVYDGDRFQADMSFDAVRIWGESAGRCSEP